MLVSYHSLEPLVCHFSNGEKEDSAFAHALKIALVAGTELALFHVEASPSANWQDFPAVRDPVKACLGFLKKHHLDLIVLAVCQHEERMRWLDKSVV